MDPSEVFDRFNNIIGPDFSLITGRISNPRSDTGGDTPHDKGPSKAASEPTSQGRLREPDNRSCRVLVEDQKLIFQGEICRNIHGTLFRPKDMVYIRRDLASLADVAEEECVLVTDIEERGTSVEDKGVDGKATHVLRYARALYNGRHLGVTKHSIEIGSSSREIVSLTATDLGVIPMRLLPPADRRDVRARLISRGKKYRRICERLHVLMQYEGQVIPLGQGTDWTWTTNQRVVVDGIAAQKMRVDHVNNSSTASHPGQGLKTFLGSESHSMPDGGDQLSGQGRDLMNDNAMPGAKGTQKSSVHGQTRADPAWTDIDYLTCPPTLVAFLLDETVWANIQVEHLNDVVWPENPLNSLELEAGKKRLIQDFTRRFKAKESNENSKQLKREGQSGNLIMLLSGPPGVGKTLTAEVVAEETHRPLYRVTAGELGVNPSALEKQLSDIFLLARRWGAIILIDEADMFMTKRRASTPDQNATVTAFLRLFHTYDGLLFLTSTSKDIDTAFYDRIHATIEYTELDEPQRTNIWRRQLQRAISSPEGHPPNSPWPGAYRLLGKVEINGREIRNIVRTAEQLALGLSTDLAMEHVAAAMRNYGGSDNYIKSIYKKLEVLEGQLGDDRGQACSNDIELQHSISERYSGISVNK